MFDKLRLKLTIIYTGIFSLLVVMIVTGCIILLGHSVLTHEKQEMRELIIHEGEEFVASGELPVSKHSIEVGRELAYMLQPGSDMLLHDQVSGSPVGQQLLALRSEWPQHDRKVKWVTLRDANDRLWIDLLVLYPVTAQVGYGLDPAQAVFQRLHVSLQFPVGLVFRFQGDQ